MREVYCANYERCMHEKASWKGVYKASYLYGYIIHRRERSLSAPKSKSGERYVARTSGKEYI